MYRIQAYNAKHDHFTVRTAQTMEERDTIIRTMIESGEYHRAGITFEWLAR